MNPVANNTLLASIEGRLSKYFIELENHPKQSRSVLITQIDKVSGRAQAIRIAEIDLLSWLFEINKIGDALGIVPPAKYGVSTEETKAYSVADKRQRHPKAYMPWTTEEESLLAELFQKGMPIAQISRELQRNCGAIRSRLEKLGLHGVAEEGNTFSHTQRLADPLGMELGDKDGYTPAEIYNKATREQSNALAQPRISFQECRSE